MENGLLQLSRLTPSHRFGFLSRDCRLLTSYESKQVRIYLILVRRAHPVGRARIDLERRITNNFR